MKSNFDKFPVVKIKDHLCIAGWQPITDALQNAIDKKQSEKIVFAVECYHGVDTNELQTALQHAFPDADMVNAVSVLKPSDEIEKMVYPFVTDDPVFGYITLLHLAEFFDDSAIQSIQKELSVSKSKLVIVYGIGASLIADEADLLVYADMPRWEIKLRFRRNSISNMATENREASFAYQYKRSFFVDWRVLDRHKKP